MGINSESIKRMRRQQSQIMKGRRVKPGDFYLRKFTVIARTPEGANTYEITEHMRQPVVEVLKGDEAEIWRGMEMYSGDVICTFTHAVDLVFEEPDEVGGYFHDEVRYLGNRYGIIKIWPRGLGSRANRVTVFATRIGG